MKKMMYRPWAVSRGLGVLCMAVLMSACATNPEAADDKANSGERYERPDHVTGTNLVRKDRSKSDVKLGNKEAIEDAAMRAGAAAAVRMSGGKN